MFGYSGITIDPGYAIRPGNDGLPVSRSMPRKHRQKGDGSEVKNVNGKTIVQFPDGSQTNAMGQRLVKNRNDLDRACGQTGYRYDRDF